MDTEMPESPAEAAQETKAPLIKLNYYSSDRLYVRIGTLDTGSERRNVRISVDKDARIGWLFVDDEPKFEVRGLGIGASKLFQIMGDAAFRYLVIQGRNRRKSARRRAEKLALLDETTSAAPVEKGEENESVG